MQKTTQKAKKTKPIAAKKATKPAAPKNPTVAKKNKTKKTKPATDPNAPKKPLSGFMKFSQEHRATVKEENPDLTFGGIGKKLGDMWRALSSGEKAAYKPAVEVKPMSAVAPTAPAILAA